MTTLKTPPVTDSLRAAARRQPGGWVYAIDPVFDPEGRVPPTGVVGAWKVDDRGDLTGDFTPNPSYVPSPVARGWRSPTSPLEFALQAAGSGLGSNADLHAAFLSASVWIFAQGTGDEISVAEIGDGAQGVFAFSDALLASAAGAGHMREISGAALLAAMPVDSLVVLNSGSPVVANVSKDDCVVATIDE